MSDKKIRAIETRYAGCRFRSRLEARWAVFFDTLGITWQYEPQGFELPSGRYLPDFRISGSYYLTNDSTIWAEVKGTMDPPGLVRLIRAATELERLSPGPLSPQIVVLGDIPEPGWGWTHIRVEVSDERWLLRPAAFFSGDEEPLLKGVGDGVPYNISWLDQLGSCYEEHVLQMCSWMTEPTYMPRLMVDPVVDAAYRAARSARFEFGESG